MELPGRDRGARFRHAVVFGQRGATVADAFLGV